MTQVKIEIRLKRPRPRLDRCKALVHWLVQRSRRHYPDGRVPWHDITVLLVGHKAMIGAHRAVFGKSGSTDVISMVYAPLPGIDDSGTAELLVNVERAQEEGRKGRRGSSWSPTHELALYLAHGINHLTGADDATPCDRRKMRARDLHAVHAADRAGLLRGLLRQPASVHHRSTPSDLISTSTDSP